MRLTEEDAIHELKAEIDLRMGYKEPSTTHTEEEIRLARLG